MFSGVVERDQWHEMGQGNGINIVYIVIYDQMQLFANVLQDRFF